MIKNVIYINDFDVLIKYILNKKRINQLVYSKKKLLKTCMFLPIVKI